MARVLGVDVSNFQANADWAALKAQGVGFGWAKVSQGTYQVESWPGHRDRARAAGVPIGGYGWATFDTDPHVSAHTFLQHHGPMLPGMLPPCLDVEDVYANGKPTGQNPSQRANWIEVWIADVEAALGVNCVIYSGPWYWTPYVEARQGFTKHPLWLASYPGNTDYRSVSWPRTMAPWSTVSIFQFAGSVPALGLSSVDLDVAEDTFIQSLLGGQAPVDDQEAELMAAKDDIMKHIDDKVSEAYNNLVTIIGTQVLHGQGEIKADVDSLGLKIPAAIWAEEDGADSRIRKIIKEELAAAGVAPKV